MADELTSIAQQALRMGVQEAERGYLEELKTSDITADMVILSMRKFYEKFSNWYEIREIQIREKKKFGKDSAEYKIQRLKMKDLEKEIYPLFFDFQYKFNLYYGKLIKTVFVYYDENGSAILYTGEDKMSMLTPSLQYTAAHIKNLNNLIALEQEEYDSTNLDAARQEVDYRFGIATSRYDRSTFIPILWKIGGEWYGAIVNNRGTIAEAYANFFLNEVEFSGDIEPDVGQYVTDNEHGMMSVDNTPGFFAGDVDRGQIQYQIKAEGAGPGGFIQVGLHVQKILADLNNLKLTEAQAIETLKGKLEKDIASANAPQVYMLRNSLEKTVNKLTEFKGASWYLGHY